MANECTLAHQPRKPRRCPTPLGAPSPSSAPYVRMPELVLGVPRDRSDLFRQIHGQHPPLPRPPSRSMSSAPPAADDSLRTYAELRRAVESVFYANGVKANVLFFDNKPAAKEPWTTEVWYYDYRTNVHHTLKRKPMRFEDLADFFACYHPANRRVRKETWHAEKNPEGRWRRYTYAELVARDKTSLDLFWLKDQSLADLESLRPPVRSVWAVR